MWLEIRAEGWERFADVDRAMRKTNTSSAPATGKGASLPPIVKEKEEVEERLVCMRKVES